MPIELKICGINSKNIIKTIVRNGGCQYLGFIFYPPSPRHLSIQQSKELTSIVPNYIKKVAVLVKPEKSFVEKIKNQFDYLQVYETSPSELQLLKLISRINVFIILFGIPAVFIPEIDKFLHNTIYLRLIFFKKL